MHQMNNEVTLLSLDEQQEISGGINWSCFASGALIAGGVLTLQPEAVTAGIFGAATTC
jgi:hypothetical protein